MLTTNTRMQTSGTMVNEQHVASVRIYFFFGEPIVCHYLPQMNVHFAAPLYNFSVCVRPSTLSTSIKPQKCYRQKPTLTTAIYICGKENLILSMHWIFFFFFKKTTTSNNHLKQQMNERCYYYCYHYCY